MTLQISLQAAGERRVGASMSWGQQCTSVVDSGEVALRADEWLLAATGSLECPVAFITNSLNPSWLVAGSVSGAPPKSLCMYAESAFQKCSIVS